MRMANQGCESDFGEAKVVSDTRKTVPQHVRLHVPVLRVLEPLLPALREISDRVVDALAGKDVRAGSLRSLRLQILHDGKPHPTHRGALFNVEQPKATAFQVNLAPSVIDDFSAQTARNRNQTEDLGLYPVADAPLRL